VKLQKLEDTFWEDTTWANIKEKYPKAKILISKQDFQRPTSWKKYNDVIDIVKIYSN
jgi:hypothetical protein